MEPVELVRRVRKVLTAMRGLSEAGTANLSGDRVKGGGAKSAPPPGAVLGTQRDLRDLSLADYWHDRFHAARGNERRLTTFVFLAERDLARAQRRQPGHDPHEQREMRERRVLLQYRGLSPLEAALAEDCSEGWIRKVRNARRHDPQSGEPLGPSDVPAERTPPDA